MQTITKSFNTYDFSELAQPVQEKIISKWRENDVTFEIIHANDVIHDATEILKLIGFSDVKISYSGFNSQGDGASFTGNYEYNAQALEKVREYAPLDVKLHEIVAAIQACNVSNANIARHSYNYSHENTVITDAFDAEGNSIESEIGVEFALLMKWIYSELQESYDWFNDDKTIRSEIIENDYKFLGTGEIYND